MSTYSREARRPFNPTDALMEMYEMRDRLDSLKKELYDTEIVYSTACLDCHVLESYFDGTASADMLEEIHNIMEVECLDGYEDGSLMRYEDAERLLNKRILEIGKLEQRRDELKRSIMDERRLIMREARKILLQTHRRLRFIKSLTRESEEEEIDAIERETVRLNECFASARQILKHYCDEIREQREHEKIKSGKAIPQKRSRRAKS